jgi:NAD(P)-dependent dehydrogenase (short-subunit alcohol dehydrogenase family)
VTDDKRPPRVAVVTGGTRGLGAAISQRLVSDGARVIAVFRNDEASARAFVDSVDSGRVTTRRLDVTDPDACRQLVSSVTDEFGTIDYLVNNAGALTEAKYDDISTAAWNATLEANLSAPFHLSQAALRPMREQRFGRIVNVGSVSSFMGSPFQVDYAAAKAGLVGLTRSLARAVARRGITVNCVVPGGFDTDLLQDMTLTDRHAIEQTIPVGRFGHAPELAHVVAALLADEAAYVTGSVIVVDGGMSMGT